MEAGGLSRPGPAQAVASLRVELWSECLPRLMLDPLDGYLLRKLRRAAGRPSGDGQDFAEDSCGVGPAGVLRAVRPVIAAASGGSISSRCKKQFSVTRRRRTDLYWML